MARRRRFNGRGRGRRNRRATLVPFTLFGSVSNTDNDTYKLVDLKDLGGAAIFSGRPIRLSHARFEFVSSLGTEPTRLVPSVLECMIAGDLGDKNGYAAISRPRPVGASPVVFTLRNAPGIDFCTLYDDATPVLRINRLQLNSPGFSYAIIVWIELGSYTHARNVE